MISQDEIVSRCSRLVYFHLASYLYECSGNQHVIILRLKLTHPNYTTALDKDFVVKVSLVDGKLMATSFRNPPKTIILKEHV